MGCRRGNLVSKVGPTFAPVKKVDGARECTIGHRLRHRAWQELNVRSLGACARVPPGGTKACEALERRIMRLDEYPEGLTHSAGGEEFLCR